VKILCILFILSTLSTSHAKLGETVAEIEARYGKGTEADHPIWGLSGRIYSFKGFEIIVVFDAGKCIIECLSSQKSNQRMDDAEALSLASAIAGDKPWKKQPYNEMLTDFWRQDGGPAFAMRCTELFKSDQLYVGKISALNRMQRKIEADKQKTASAFSEPVAKPTEPPTPDPAAEQAAAQKREALTAQILAENRKTAADLAIFKFHYERALAGGEASQRRLAQLYLTGTGCEKDTNAAAAWLRAAATNTPAR
jgi:TPR repeat protein